jgi:hypothetical protein
MPAITKLCLWRATCSVNLPFKPSTGLITPADAWLRVHRLNLPDRHLRVNLSRDDRGRKVRIWWGRCCNWYNRGLYATFGTGFICQVNQQSLLRAEVKITSHSLSRAIQVSRERNPSLKHLV